MNPCPNGTMWRPSCKRRSCPVCGPRWARDWQRVLAVNFEAVGAPVATIAITAPGKDRLPWDDHYCYVVRGRDPEKHKHAGKYGCRCEQRPLREWAETLSWRWQKLRHAARIATKRELGYAPPWILARVWEPQKRGAPHLHLAVPYGTATEQLAARCFLKHLKRLAPDYDFGRAGREKGKGPELQPITGADAARYLANYLAGRTSKKGTIRDNIADPRLPRSLLWLTPKLTRRTFVTMRTLRRARHLWAAVDGRCDPPRWVDVVEAVKIAVVFRSIYPKRAGPVGDAAAAVELAHSINRRVVNSLPRVGDDLPPDGWRAAFDRDLARFAFVATRPVAAVAA